jgi:hypothetical protein
MSTPAASQAAPPAAKPKGKQTGYIVLAKNGDSDWLEAGFHDAASADAAIRQAAAESDGTSTFVAIPKRSWHPKKPKLTTKTVVTLETA